MQKSLKRFNELKVQIKVVSFAKPEVLKTYVNNFSWQFPVYSDTERKAYHQLSMKRGNKLSMIHPTTLASYARVLLKGYKVEKPTDDVYQMGGDFLIDSEGILRYAHPSKRPDDRPSVKTLLKEISRL